MLNYGKIGGDLMIGLLEQGERSIKYITGREESKAKQIFAPPKNSREWFLFGYASAFGALAGAVGFAAWERWGPKDITPVEVLAKVPKKLAVMAIAIPETIGETIDKIKGGVIIQAKATNGQGQEIGSQPRAKT